MFRYSHCPGSRTGSLPICLRSGVHAELEDERRSQSSLARAFFEAGARTVVASRWPLRDDEALQLFSSFYEELERGAKVAAAMREARCRAVAEGLPARAWAGALVLGDGNATVRVESTGRRPRSGIVLPATAAALLLLSLAFGLRRVAHRRRRARAGR